MLVAVLIMATLGYGLDQVFFRMLSGASRIGFLTTVAGNMPRLMHCGGGGSVERSLGYSL